jgi:hypothetical protein
MSITVATAPPDGDLAYKKQDCAMTLAQGLQEYYRANSDHVFTPGNVSQRGADLFLSHDLCHVIFGLDTTLGDEVMADIRTLLSCDVGLWRYARDWLTVPEAKAIYQQIETRKALSAVLQAIPRMAKAFVESRRMERKWPWQPTADDLHRSIAELRNEYGIRVI